jgi:hypothetical protein
MTEPPKLLVFQPLVSDGYGMDERLLGLQAWLGRRFAKHVEGKSTRLGRRVVVAAAAQLGNPSPRRAPEGASRSP